MAPAICGRTAQEADESETTPHLGIRGECASETPAEIKTPSPREAEFAARAAELEKRTRGSVGDKADGRSNQPPSAVAALLADELGRTRRRLRCPAVCDTAGRFALPTLRNKGRPIRFKEELSTGSHPL